MGSSDGYGHYDMAAKGILRGNAHHNYFGSNCCTVNSPHNQVLHTEGGQEHEGNGNLAGK